jgi:hypothetical protein
VSIRTEDPLASGDGSEPSHPVGGERLRVADLVRRDLNLVAPFR